MTAVSMLLQWSDDLFSKKSVELFGFVIDKNHRVVSEIYEYIEEHGFGEIS